MKQKLQVSVNNEKMEERMSVCGFKRRREDDHLAGPCILPERRGYKKHWHNQYDKI